MKHFKQLRTISVPLFKLPWIIKNLEKKVKAKFALYRAMRDQRGS